MWSNKFTWHGRKCEVRFAETLDLLHEARQIREEVFVREQGFVNEFDEIDGCAKHCLIIVEGKPAATGRLYHDKSEPFAMHIGRLAVVKSERGSGLGSLLLSMLEELAKTEDCHKLVLSAQCRAEGFYSANGYTAEGEVYNDEDCPHIRMVKYLG